MTGVEILATLDRVKAAMARKSDAELLIMGVIADLQKEKDLDPRWLATVKTDFEKAFMVLGVAVARNIVEIGEKLEVASPVEQRCAKEAGGDVGRCDPDYCYCGAEGSASAQ